MSLRRRTIERRDMEVQPLVDVINRPTNRAMQPPVYCREQQPMYDDEGTQAARRMARQTGTVTIERAFLHHRTTLYQ
jgi:hypothetical protein